MGTTSTGPADLPHLDTVMPDLPAAACRDIADPEAFFADDARRLDRTIRVEQARNICRRCPEIRACLIWALTHQEHGIWAATTTKQRADIIRSHHQKGATP